MHYLVINDYDAVVIRPNIMLLPFIALLPAISGCDSAAQTDESCYARFARDFPSEPKALRVYDLMLGYRFDLAGGMRPATEFARARQFPVTVNRTTGGKEREIAKAYSEGLLRWGNGPKVVVFDEEPARMVYLSSALPSIAEAKRQLHQMCSLAAKGMMLRGFSVHLERKISPTGGS